MERSQCLQSDVVDRERENAHIEDALCKCGYPKWTFDEVRNQMEQKKQLRRNRKSKTSLCLDHQW